MTQQTKEAKLGIWRLYNNPVNVEVMAVIRELVGELDIPYFVAMWRTGEGTRNDSQCIAHGADIVRVKELLQHGYDKFNEEDEDDEDIE